MELDDIYFTGESCKISTSLWMCVVVTHTYRMLNCLGYILYKATALHKPSTAYQVNIFYKKCLSALYSMSAESSEDILLSRQDMEDMVCQLVMRSEAPS